MRDALALLALGLGAFFLMRNSSAAVSVFPDGFSGDDFSYGDPVIDEFGDIVLMPEIDPLPIPEIMITDDASMATLEQKIAAFLQVIRRAEHTYAIYRGGLDYVTTYGNGVFRSFADHPAITGEMTPVRLPDEYCAKAGINAPCYSTAAGAYQINKPTWNDFRQAGQWGPYLSDFSPASQDEAALRILYQIGAIALLDNNDLAGAIAKASTRWASLPRSLSGQPKRTFAEVASWYNENLGA